MSTESRQGLSNYDDEGELKSPVSSQKQTINTQYCYESSGMTPSIITTINNTDPNNIPVDYPSIIANNNNGARSKRTTEQYESYIEDSFVGHWEHEDDDVDEYQDDFNTTSAVKCENDTVNLQHPSTIEFDFDSFGPESFIYTPAPMNDTNPNDANVPLSDEDRLKTNVRNDSDSAICSAQKQSTPIDADAELNQNEEDETKKVNNINTQTSIDNTAQNVDSKGGESTRRGQMQCMNFKPQYDIIDPAQIDMKVIEPYKKVISHAGYCHHTDPSVRFNPVEPAPAVIVFSACYLPDRSRRDYNYVMDHLFLYVLTSLHELIADDYILIYLHNTQSSNGPSGPSTSIASRLSLSSNSAPLPTSSTTSSCYNGEEAQHQNNLPTFTWMKRCYQMIDRRLRKNLRILYLVKPTFWLKTIVIMCKPFISAKFSKKLRFVEDMDGLKKCIPVDKLILPASADNI